MPGKSQRKAGSAMHRAKPSEIFDAFADYCSFSPDINIAKSYIYGFILHYALDRNCHPYIYSLQNRITDTNKKIHKNSAHNKIEHSIDSYMLNSHLGYCIPSDFDSASTISTLPEITDEISHLISFAVSRTTPYIVSEEEVLQSILDTKLCQKILRDKSGNLAPFLTVSENIFAPIIKNFKISVMIKPNDLEKAKKYVNINNCVWVSPYDTAVQHNESFEDLFELSKLDAKKLINGFNKMCKGYENGLNVTQNISFLTGVKIK